MTQPLSRDEYARQLDTAYGPRRTGEFKAEFATVQRYFEAVSARLADTYTLQKVLAVGGTGIVLLGSHTRFAQAIVVKFNRPNVDAGATSMVDHEAHVLPTLSHPNIVRVLDLGQLPDQAPPLTYIVEPFIAGSQPLFSAEKERISETWLAAKLDVLKRSMPETLPLPSRGETSRAIASVSSLLRDVAALFSQWTNLLSNVHCTHPPHSVSYVYLDVKPDNVLVDDHLHLTSIDYGSAEPLDSTDPTPLQVFFTERYAHPTLLRRKKEKASSNRVRSAIKRSELSSVFDQFALGVSMLEILNQIALVRPHLIPQLPLYRALHFLATRLLDGQNSARRPDDAYEYAPQVFQSLHDSDYAHLRYSGLEDACRDLDKERGRWSLESQVPELATYSKDIVRVVPGYNTVLTPRLRSVIEHPLVGRLKFITQLGLVSLVYPTADHSRYDHALGSYTYATYYVKSLFNDIGSPLFRNIVRTQDVNALLLAALLHDLGQYPLAHDLEEVHERIFKHGQLSTALLDDPMPDFAGRTLLEIIEDPQNGWNVPGEALRRILGAHSKNLAVAAEAPEVALKTDILTSIIDGPVDADKADYIVRDSVRCELPYGGQLDLERFLRVLTVAVLPKDVWPGRRVALGVYDKGLASAHAFGQARYQLFATVYWHHTVRIAKAMLQYATALGLPLEVFGPFTAGRQRAELQLRERLMQFVKSLVPPFAHHPEGGRVNSQQPELDLGAEPPEDVITSLPIDATRSKAAASPIGANEWYPGIAWTDLLMLDWIADLPGSSPRSRSLVRGIRTRHLYKRVATFARGGPYGTLIRKLDGLDWPARVNLCTKLHHRACDRLRRDWANLTTTITMSRDELDSLCESSLLILLDIPDPSKKVGYDRPLGVVPELKEKSYHQDTGQAAEDKEWRETVDSMMRGIAPVRILCHPDVRNILSAVYAPAEASLASQLMDLLGLGGL